ncbi:serine phosphatase RsbU (regulator of sigma subunit)/anti-sigma regulatory factor (Ser/Thr protein kinase)/anti-anti-sigma regulatory factor [Actinokineospora baliensis]|uniref:SpoIIE family protein phosphatase n=1 Tax=Actinokineospora baliensis TaxID=547056 RepID=UPI00195628ED|nr:SpoIIE family protein phosphatase [Actinokineospora baliensis]MBM7773170.1 serine phosphatase RsbU (regulator of sigma subunit)/anti-sigma regulatory factor (Ser/Thr protein kinase)/anti-anti-sigma regulatory factor [Actinokineospora baliensis]
MELDPERLVGGADAVRAVFEGLPIMLAGLDGPELVIVAANAAYRTAMGREQLVGLTPWEAFPDIVGQQTIEMVYRVYRTGRPESGVEWRVQFDRHATGEGVVEAYFDFTTAPRLDDKGNVVGVVLFAHDVTDRVRQRQTAERKAAEAERRYAEAREVITALQRQLLPPGLPVLPSVRIAGSYLLADGADASGGDWFDAVPLADGRVGLVVGDVVGHGVAASAAMGRLRAVLRDRLEETGDVRTAVAAVDRMARRGRDTHAATVCVVVLDQGGDFEYCTAGHPPPLVAGAGQARYVPLSGGGPLGTGSTHAVATDRLDPGDVLLLYSDGIVERPGREPAASSVELAQVLADAVADTGYRTPGLPAVERATALTLEMMIRTTGHADDITLLAAQRVAPVDPLHLTLPGDLEVVRAVRRALLAWLVELGAGEQDVVALQHAVVELVTNAVEHSRPDRADGTITLDAALAADGVLRISVTDDGRWLRRCSTTDQDFHLDHGLGLAMAGGLADELHIARTTHGTTATLHRELSRPARLLTADQVTSGAPAGGGEPGLLLVLDQPQTEDNRVALDGPLDVTTGAQLTAELDRLTLGGSHELTVDLTGVTHVASVAVAILHRAVERGERNRAPLWLYAPAGSVADHVLTLVSLEHDRG